MKRDTVVPILTTLLAALALPATGILRASWLPAASGAYYGAALTVCALFILIVPAARRPAALHPALWLLAALPFLVFGVLGGAQQRPGGWLPAPGWFALAAAGWLITCVRRPGLVAAALVLCLGGGAVLATAGLETLPAGWNPVTQPLPRAASDRPPVQAGDGIRGIRRGAPVVLPPDAQPALLSGAGPFWVRAQAATHPGPRPVVLVLDGVPRGVRPWSGVEATIVPAAEAPFSDALDLLAFDALVVRGGAWPDDDPRAGIKARAVAGFVRKGGLLIGPAPEHDWPAELGRQLRGSGRSHVRGASGLRRLGLGRVARAATREDVTELLASGAWVPEVSSRLAKAMPPAPLSGVRFQWHDDPARRRPQGVLLLVYAGVVAALTWFVRRRGVQVLGILLASGAVAVGLAWLVPREAGFRCEGLVTDLGGPGGRRCEALVLSAGPQGFEGRVAWAGGGVLSIQGATTTPAGALRVAPGRTAWIIRETTATGPASGEAEDRRAALLRALLEGDVDPRRLRYGRLAALPIQVEGSGPVPAWTVSYRAP